ncbi:MAG TPA: DUF4388 domain-containing protein [Polyangiaceae bacterium]|nr:DUF4388 domain-containing protein [Polyangiaceae bacterium]
MTVNSQLLLVDADPRSMRVLEVSLRAEGFDVVTATDANQALEKCQAQVPDLILTETRLAEMDGFELVKQLKAKPEYAQIPIVFLSNQKSIDDKIKGLQLGVEDYLTKPIFVRELITRINMLLARRTHDRIQEGAPTSSRTRFAGSLEDMGVVDLLQTLDVSRKTGVLRVRSGKYQAAVYFQEGQLVDAEMGRLAGEEAVYRMLTWHAGEFEVEIKAITQENVVNKPLQTLLMEGMRRVDEWGRLAKELPELDRVVAVNERVLAERVSEIPEELTGILRLLDGQRTVLDVVDESPFDDLSTLAVLAKLHGEGLLVVSTAMNPLDAHAIVPRSSAPPLAFAWGRPAEDKIALSAAVSAPVPYDQELRTEHLRAPAVPMGFVRGADYGTPAHGVAVVDRVSGWPSQPPDELETALAQGTTPEEQERQRRTRGWVLAAVILALAVLLFASVRTMRHTGELAEQGTPRVADTTVAAAGVNPALAASVAAPVPSAAPSASAEPAERPSRKRRSGVVSAPAVPSGPVRLPNGRTPTAVFPEDTE